MKFGIYCNNFTDHNLNTIHELQKMMEAASVKYCIFKDLNDQLLNPAEEVFSNEEELKSCAETLVTVGGDGTILNAIKFVAGSEIPVLGVNTGRLGFLTSITPDEMPIFLEEISNDQFKMEERALLEVTASDKQSTGHDFALNEVSVLKKDSSSMITIHAELDGELLNTYWADGLIISTATGSTAYSLSCGGPIVMPGMGNIIINPIAPHNLNVRPLVIDDSSEIVLRFETRSNEVLLSLDSSARIISNEVSIRIKRARPSIKLLRRQSYSYLETIRNKLNWGLDKRN